VEREYVVEETCSCGQRLSPQVLHSPAGYYVGYFCPQCGPWDRISSYYKTSEQAENILAGYEER